MSRHKCPGWLERDIELAFALLEGAPQLDRRGLPKFARLTAATKPTEREAREALTRVLLSMADDYKDERKDILIELASAFSNRVRLPTPVVPPSPFQLIIKRSNQGAAEPWRDFTIAWEVKSLRDRGLSYDDAAAKVAEKFKFKDPRRVKTIYARWQQRMTVASDKRTDDMASDS
jgi:hypothetical protein